MRLSTDGMVDIYPKVWNNINFQKFERITEPRGSYIPSWVYGNHTKYVRLAQKGKKKTNSFT